MGWTSLETRAPFRSIFDREYEEQIINNHIVRSIELRVDPPQNEDSIEESEIFSAISFGGLIYAHVVKFKRTRNNEVFYRGYDETKGPGTFNKCPREILQMLSDPDKFDESGISKAWRERQWK